MTFSQAWRAPDPTVRARVERATGADLRAARVHAGPDVDRRALALGARAFTAGRDVHLASGAGDRVLAHELTHVAQQGAADVAGGGQGLAVRPARDAAEREADAVAAGASPGRVTPVAPAVQRAVAQKQTKAETLAAGEIAKYTGSSYWVWRLGAVYDLVVAPRFADTEERDAVMSLAWAEHAKVGKVTKKTERVVHVAARGGATKAVAYRLTFQPAPDADSKPSLEFTFLAEDAAAAGAAGSVAAATPAAGYAARDAVDAEIDAWRARGAANKLGAIAWPASVPAAERVPVKYAIWRYADSGTRNAEVDAVVPLPGGTTRVLYTLTFSGAANDVAVERLGVEGKDTAALDVAKRQLDVKRVRGYDPAFDADAGKLKAWLATRYPGVTTTATDAPKLVTEANTKLNADAGTPAWFQRNYGMPVVDATTGESRLRTVHALDTQQADGMKDYTAAELRLVELALETLSDTTLGAVRGAALARQEEAIDKKVTGTGAAATVTYVRDKSTWGRSLRTGAARTVVVYDRVTSADASLFIGGAGGVSPFSLMTVVHELGHLVGWTGTVAADFNTRFVDAKAKLKTAPITWYAATKPSEEFFQEAFAVYHADPAWMKANLPTMFAWFEALSATGKAP